MGKVFNYSDNKWRLLKVRVLKRDKYTCQFCGILALGKKRNGISPVVDHIETVKDRPDLAMDINNLRVLCRPCDNKRHSEKGKGGVDVPEVCADGFPANSEWRQ